MVLSTFSQNKLQSTCCHIQNLSKGGNKYVSIYNGLSYWARVEDGKGNLIENLWSEFDEDGELGVFTPQDFIRNGYNLV